MRLWTVEYLFNGELLLELRDCPYPGCVDDNVILRDEEYRISFVTYRPEQGVVNVLLSKYF